MNTMQNPPVRNQSIVDSAKEIARLAEVVSEILAERSSNQKLLLRIIRFLNFFVGSMVGLLTLLAITPQFSSYFGSHLPTILSLTAALFLLFDAGLPAFLDEPNPERFHDYYINSSDSF